MASTTYNFVGINNPSTTHKGEYGDADTFPGTSLTIQYGETEYSSGDYDSTESSNDVRRGSTTGTLNRRPVDDFRFKITESVSSITQLDYKHEGYGQKATGGGQFNWYIWNVSSSAWESIGSHTNTSDTNSTGTTSSSIGSYIDGSGFFYLRAIGGTKDILKGAGWLYTDYVELVVTYTVAGTHLLRSEFVGMGPLTSMVVE